MTENPKEYARLPKIERVGLDLKLFLKCQKCIGSKTAV